jgi:hypothetical protein
LIVTAALQKYSDRGVFRGLKTTRRPGGRYEYTFTWLMRRSFTLSYDPARRVLSFKNLFPNVTARSPIATALREVVAERSTNRVPAHKRLDGRRVQASCGIRGGGFWLTMRVRGEQGAYAVQQLLGLVNELFLVLHETFPDYVAAEFGLSSE